MKEKILKNSNLIAAILFVVAGVVHLITKIINPGDTTLLKVLSILVIVIDFIVAGIFFAIHARDEKGKKDN